MCPNCYYIHLTYICKSVMPNASNFLPSLTRLKNPQKIPRWKIPDVDSKVKFFEVVPRYGGFERSNALQPKETVETRNRLQKCTNHNRSWIKHNESWIIITGKNENLKTILKSFWGDTNVTEQLHNKLTVNRIGNVHYMNYAIKVHIS